MTCSLRAATYEQNFSLPPIELSASDLRMILATISEEIARANPTPSENQHPEYSIVITDAKTGSTVNFDEFVIPEVHLPSPATDIRVNYSFHNAPVSSINFKFSDYERSLTVAGESYTDVTGTATLLERELSRYTVPFGGPNRRMIFEMGTYVGIIGFLVFFAYFRQKWLAYKLIFFAIPLVSVVIWDPLEYIMPGFVFHESEPSWIVRYSPQIAFVGVFTSLLIPILQSIYAQKPLGKQHKKKHETSI
jgi:hypothetical protein